MRYSSVMPARAHTSAEATKHDIASKPQARNADTTSEPARPGRKRDASRDAAILEAALDVLVETGFEAMTIEMVAERARAGKGTVYRRWSTKTELVLTAVACLRKTGAADD